MDSINVALTRLETVSAFLRDPWDRLIPQLAAYPASWTPPAGPQGGLPASC